MKWLKTDTPPDDGLYVLGTFGEDVVMCTYGQGLWLSQEHGDATPDWWTHLPIAPEKTKEKS